MIQITPTVKQLLIINVLFYIGSQIVGPPAYDLLSMYYPENPKFHFWQIFTHMFMHAPPPNYMHIVFNMFALYSFGSALEQFWGGKKFLFFYISCGLGSALLYNLFNFWEIHQGIQEMMKANIPHSDIVNFMTKGQTVGKYSQEILGSISMEKVQNMAIAYNGQMLGASGAIYGLLVAFGFMFPNAEMFLMFIPIPIKAKYLISGVLILDLVLGLYGSSFFGPGGTGVAHFAHLGGALIGFLMMWYWKKNQFNGKRWN
ncbi:rhomboid family intramembrane serine protease [Flavobacterium silvaticum]|uniref:Rhomboid family intramembrane serine protease n=1 Tax=Flavobacterium silvaticum TaxID=1852020 RepID=A0A972FNL9_9FLAO|nr:rhomboid family intramembrane serine protease [Flavobacterium silvaticum]NMH29364.1 rhomboid family intramembrane serine protease [Flavobacterium silvaticum]